MKRVTIQIYTGGFDSPAEKIDIPALLSKLRRIYSKADVECVIVGWSPKNLPIEIIELIKRHGTDIYLWLPVFSGWDNLAPLTAAGGRQATQDYRAVKGERFDFGCPVNPANVNHVISIYKEHYRSFAYDGVFLDKIRFPSFIGGADSVLTCFCQFCKQRHNITEDLAVCDNENPLCLTGYSGLRYTSANINFARLFDYKAEAVTASVGVLSHYFREQGLKVGLDLFAPFLSYFVGQDYRTLAPYADFIKPMFYRKTNAPAGIPFEMNMYASAFGTDRKLEDARERFLLDMIGTSAVDATFINREISGIRDAIGSTKLFAGVEVNYNESIAPITTQYIEENSAMLKGADGFALSWDICEAPDENINAALR